MNHHLMIFRNEATGECYVYNGEEVINVSPSSNGRAILWPREVGKEVETTYNSRKKIFIHDKTRHIIVEHVRYKTD